MKARTNTPSTEAVFNTLVITFMAGPILALIGLYTSPALALGAFFIQIVLTAFYFATRDSGPGLSEKVARAAEESKARGPVMADPHPVA